MELVFAAAAFIGTAAIFVIIGLLATARSQSTAARLRELSPVPDIPPVAAPRPGSRVDTMPTLTRLMSGKHFTEQLYVELAAAGLRIRPSEFIGVIAGAVIISQVLAALLFRSMLGHIVLAIVAIILPLLVLKHLQQKRLAAFSAQIVDALVLMASSLRSGFSFLRAMQMVAQEMPPPISTEFERMINEINVGRDMEDALQGLVARIKSYDLELVVTAVQIQLQVGGNLADILETIAGTIRERVRVMGEMRALTAEGKLSGVVLILLPIALGILLTIINPGYMSIMFTQKIGHYLIGTAAVLQIVGAYVIKKMLVLDI